MTSLVGWLRRDPPTVLCPSCGHHNVGANVRWCGWCGHALEEARSLDTPRRPIPRRSRRTPAFIAVAGVALLGLLLASGLRSTPDVPRGLTSRGDAGRSGEVSLADLEAPSEIAWSAQLELDPTSAVVDQRVAVGADLAITVRGTRVIGLDASSGQAQWSHDLGGAVAAVRGVAVLDGAVAVGTTPADVDGDEAPGVSGIVLLDADDGSRLATSARIGATYPLVLPSTTPLLAVDDLLIESDSSTVTASRLQEGALRTQWQVDVTTSLDASVVGLVTATPTTIVAVASRPAGIVLQSNVSAGDSMLVGISAANGAVRWARPYPQEMPFTPIGRHGGEVAVANTSTLDVIDLATGSVLEQFSRPDGVTGVALSDTRLAVATESGLVVGSDRATSQTLWAVPASRTAGAGLRVEALPDGGFLAYDRAQDNDAVVLGGDLGDMLGVVRLGSRTVADSNGSLVVADDGDSVVALDTAGQVRWRAEVPQPAVLGLATDGTAVTVQAPDGTAIVDGRTGERLASIRRGFGRFPADRQGGPVVTDGTTTVLSPLSFDGARAGLIAIDAVTGIPRWDREGDVPTAEGPLTLSGDRVWLPVSDEVHAYALEDGRRAYAARAGVPRGPLAVTPELIVAAASSGAAGTDVRRPGDEAVVIGDQAGPPHDEPDLRAPLIALGRESRRVTWSADTGGCGTVAVRGDTVWSPTPQGVVARSLATGSVRWAQEAANGSCMPLTVAGGVVVHVRGRTVTALDADDGEVRWVADLARAVTTVPVAAGDVVVMTDATGLLQALALDDGEPRWQFGLPAPAAAPPVVVARRLVVLLDDGRLVALR